MEIDLLYIYIYFTYKRGCFISLTSVTSYGKRSEIFVLFFYGLLGIKTPIRTGAICTTKKKKKKKIKSFLAIFYYRSYIRSLLPASPPSPLYPIHMIWKRKKEDFGVIICSRPISLFQGNPEWNVYIYCWGGGGGGGGEKKPPPPRGKKKKKQTGVLG